MTEPISSLKTILRLRLVSLAAFPAGAALMAGFERSPLALAILTAAMLGVSLYERRRLAGLAGIPATLNPGQLAMGFAFRFCLLIGLFVVVTGLLALFRDTSLARQLGWIDLALVALPAGAALAANQISARLAGRTFTTAEDAPPPGEGIVIEGEVIHEDPPT